MRLAFMGTPDFAVGTLLALAEAGHEIAAVYCRPPRPARRGQKLRASPVQRAAEARGWDVRHPASLRDPAAQAAFRALDLDVAVVVAYGQILPKAILAAPRLGCLNVHGSLLPRWRGAAPIQCALLAGDGETGVTVMRMDEGLDTGPMLLGEAFEIGPETTAADLHDGLAALGAALMVRVLRRLTVEPDFAGKPQPQEGVTYAGKLEKREGRLDWRQPAAALERRVRAFTPWPGAYFQLGGETIKVLRAAVVSSGGAPGLLLDDALTVACGEDALRLLEVQRAGKKPLAAADFLRGFALPKGEVLPCPDTN